MNVLLVGEDGGEVASITLMFELNRHHEREWYWSHLSVRKVSKARVVSAFGRGFSTGNAMTISRDAIPYSTDIKGPPRPVFH